MPGARRWSGVFWMGPAKRAGEEPPAPAPRPPWLLVAGSAGLVSLASENSLNSGRMNVAFCTGLPSGEMNERSGRTATGGVFSRQDGQWKAMGREEDTKQVARLARS